jgi:hypothetical protein
MEGARDNGAVQDAFADWAASVETDVRHREEGSVDVEQGDGVTLDHDDFASAGRNFGNVRDADEGVHRDGRTPEETMNIAECSSRPSRMVPRARTMTREEKAKFLAQVREFVLSMTRIEAAMPTLGERLTKDERKEAFKEIFEWLESTMEIPPNSFAREWARELLAHIGVLAQYDTYEGSADSYIA